MVRAPCKYCTETRRLRCCAITTCAFTIRFTMLITSAEHNEQREKKKHIFAASVVLNVQVLVAVGSKQRIYFIQYFRCLGKFVVQVQ